MDEQPSEDREQREAAEEAGPPGIPGLPDDDAPRDPLARELAREEAEIRRLIEAGADSPEALRELAARLREHRAREEALWRAAVKPALVKEGKGRLRGYTQHTPPVEEGEGSGSSSAWLWFLLAALVVVVVLAASTTVWIVILPVLGLLVWAWKQGRDSTS
jgi:Flp pilus assembly protein TadB